MRHHAGVRAGELSAERLGGPLGRHAGRFVGWWRLDRVLVAVVAISFLAAVATRQPCFADQYSRDGLLYSRLCYSDVPILFRERGLATGQVPYLQGRLEYPVGTGLVMEATAVLTRLLFGSGDSAAVASVRYYGVNIVLFFALAVVTVLAVARLAGPGRGRDALMVAAAPSLALAGTINWDLVPVALAVLALLAWSRSRPALAGVLLGLGGATKLWPLFLLGPLFLLCLRSRRMGTWWRAAGSAALAWLVVNVPFIVLARDQWEVFWQYNRTRGADPDAPNYGSVWNALARAGHQVSNPDQLATGLFAVLCLAIGVLALTSPVRPRVGQLAFLTVAAFTLTGTVYSPQYVLWLLPLAVLARPVWRDILIWQAAETLYWFTVWWYIAGALAPGGADPVPVVYLAAVGLRVAAQLYLVALVVRDILRPAHDPVRSAAGAAAAAPTGRLTAAT